METTIMGYVEIIWYGHAGVSFHNLGAVKELKLRFP